MKHLSSVGNSTIIMLILGIALMTAECLARDVSDEMALAAEYRSRGEFDKALATLRGSLDAATAEAEKEEVESEIADIYYVGKGDFTSAADSYTRLVFLRSAGSRRDFHLLRLALCHENLGDFITASKYYDMLIVEHPESSLATTATEGSQRCFTHNIEEHAAVVNGSPITILELERRMESLPTYYRDQYKGEEGNRKLLNEIINQELMLLEAVRIGLDKEGDIVAHLEQEKRNYLTNEIINRLIHEKSKASDAEVNEYWDKHQDEYRSDKTHHVLHIRVKERALADSLHAELLKDADFAILAREHSDHFSSKKGGDMDFYNPRILPDEVNRVVKSLKPGDLSDVVESSRGFHIVRLLETTLGDLPEFRTVKQKIRVKIEHDRRTKMYDEFIQDLKDRYPVEVYYGLK